jgi:hypothetical protein
MLGEQIAELKGKMISQRVLDSEGPTFDTSVSARVLREHKSMKP